MKNFKEFSDIVKTIEESTPVSTTTSGVDNPDSSPIGAKLSKFMGYDCVEIDDDSYSKCVLGKKPFARWSNYISDEEVRDSVKKLYSKSKRMIVKNSSGVMSFLK